MEAICLICNLNEQDEVTYGEFLSKSRLSVHYFCLAGLSDMTGFRRFLIRDVTIFAQTITKQICSYCGKGNASVHCSKCSIAFHQICGAKQGCLYEFEDRFKAYCPEHISIQEQPYPEGERCIVCEERLPAEYVVTSVVPTCCYRGWSHILCIRQYALCAGYYFKCFLCRSTEYPKMCRLRGVYVPDRDATWERDPNAYKELEKRHHHCDAKECICELGRDHVTKSGSWRMLFCASCGFFGMHSYCAKSANISLIEGTFNCEECKEILDKTMNLTKYDMNDTLVEGPEMPTFLQRSTGDSDVADDNVGTEHNEDVMEYMEKIEYTAVETNVSKLRKNAGQTDTVQTFNATVSTLGDEKIAKLTEDPVKLVESDQKSISADSNSQEYCYQEMNLSSWSYSVAHTASLLTTPAECLENCTSDTSSSLGDGRTIPVIELTVKGTEHNFGEEETCFSETSSSLGDGDFRRSMCSDKSVNEPTEVISSRSVNEANLCYVLTGSSSRQIVTEADIIIPGEANCNISKNTPTILDNSTIAMEVDEVIIISDDNTSDISEMLNHMSRPRKIVDGRTVEGTEGISREEETCFSETSSSLGDRETAVPSEFPVKLVESDQKSISADGNSQGYCYQEMDLSSWSYPVENSPSLLTNPAECLANCTSDTSSSLVDAEVPGRTISVIELTVKGTEHNFREEETFFSETSSSLSYKDFKRQFCSYKLVNRPTEVMTIRSVNEINLSYVLTGSSSRQIVTKARSEANCNINKNTPTILDNSMIVDEVIVLSDDDTSYKSEMLKEMSPPKKIVDGRKEFGGSEDVLFARRMELFLRN